MIKALREPNRLAEMGRRAEEMIKAWYIPAYADAVEAATRSLVQSEGPNSPGRIGT